MAQAAFPRAALIDSRPPTDEIVLNRNLRKPPDEPDATSHHKRQPPKQAGADGVRLLLANSPAAPELAIQQVCRKEIVSFCYTEVTDAWNAHESSANPDDVRVALRNVYGCLARNAKLLSPECFATLVHFVQLPPAAPVLPPIPSATNAVQFVGGDHRGYRTGEQRNHHRHGDDDSDDWHGRHSGTHPMMWVFVFPFFFFGLFVAMKKGVKFAKQWNDSYLQRRELAKGDVRSSEDYAPLKVQEPS